MNDRYSSSEKDEILRDALVCLHHRGISSDWTKTTQPYSALYHECMCLMQDHDFVNDLAAFLRTRTVLRRAIQMFFTQISMSARSDWTAAPPEIRPVVARGGSWVGGCRHF